MPEDRTDLWAGTVFPPTLAHLTPATNELRISPSHPQCEEM